MAQNSRGGMRGINRGSCKPGNRRLPHCESTTITGNRSSPFSVRTYSCLSDVPNDMSMSAGKLVLAALIGGCLLTLRPVATRARLRGDGTSVESDAAALKGQMSEPGSAEVEQSS